MFMKTFSTTLLTIATIMYAKSYGHVHATIVIVTVINVAEKKRMMKRAVFGDEIQVHDTVNHAMIFGINDNDIAKSLDVETEDDNCAHHFAGGLNYDQS